MKIKKVACALCAVLVVLFLLPAFHAYAFSGGSGTSIDPYQITTCADFESVVSHESSDFILENDIDCTGDGNGVMLAGDISGIFNGNGHKITVAIATIGSSGSYALFEDLSGTVENLWIDGTVTDSHGSDILDSLIYSMSSGTISNVKSTVTFSGASGTKASGLVSYMESGTIENSYYDGTITTGGNIDGGLVGEMDGGTIEDSYASGSITGVQDVGGLVGYLSGGTITNSFSVAAVSGLSPGGVVGFYSSGTLSGTVWDLYTSTQSSCDNAGGAVTGCTGVNASNATPDYFKGNSNVPISGWSTDAWEFPDGEYPELLPPTPPPPTISFMSPTPADSDTLSTGDFTVSTSSADSNGGHYVVDDFGNSLVGWWRFENNANDELGASNGTWHGTEAYTAGKFGTAGSFDGTDSYVDANITVPDNTSFTISAWVYLNSLTEAAAIVSDTTGQLLQIGGSDRWQFDNVYSADSVATTGTWTHLVGVYDASSNTETLYVNGAEVTSGGGTRSLGSDINIGRRMDGYYINGDIDDVMIFDRALGSDEVASLYDGVANQYDHAFTNIENGSYPFTAYAVDTAGNKTATEERTITVNAPVPELTEVTPIATPTSIANAVYHFTTSEACSALASEATSTLGTVETHISDPTPDTDLTAYLTGIEPGGTYSFTFLCQDSSDNRSNTLDVGPFTIFPSAPTTTQNNSVTVLIPSAPIVPTNTSTPLPLTSSSSASDPFTFTKNLKKGMDDPDVAQLEQFLDTHGFPVAASGWGSLDELSTVFGAKTLNALKLYQASVDLPATGYFGPMTRTEINGVLTGGR